MELHKDLLLEKANLILEEADKHGASQAQVDVILESKYLTRLANSIIDQNVSENHAIVRATLYFGQQSGSVEFEVFDKEGIKELVETASKLAKIAPENKDFKSLPSPKPYSKELGLDQLVSEETHAADPELRAKYASLAVDTAHAVDDRIVAVAGIVSHRFRERIIANSLGLEVYEARTDSEVELTILARDGSEETAGWAADARRNVNDLRVEDVAKIAAEKAANGFGMKYIDSGEYEVILEPAAVAGLMMMVGFIGFSARAHHDFISFLRDRIGEKIFSEKLTVWDNPLDTRLVGASLFDEEGVPHQNLELITDGVVKNITYDTMTAAKDGVESTGSQARLWGPPSPRPIHMIAKEGRSSVEEMIAETKRGVLVTHFHYQNPIKPTEGVFTGLTRDGTWYVEDGEVKYPLKTLRYTDAAPRFFKEIDLVGKHPELNRPTPFGFMPPMKLPSFRFSGSSKE